MKLILEPTDKIETVESVPCRRWEGKTDAGTPVHVWVRMLSPQTHDEAALAAFDRELKALPKVERQMVSFDFRFVT
jgi:hypothetical protein